MYYLYDRKTKEYLGEVPENFVQFYKFLYGITTIKPPQLTSPFQTVIWSEEEQKWLLVDDYRGTWWNKSNPSEKIVVTKLGTKVDTTKYTKEKPCDFCVWNETRNTWEFSIDLYRKYALQKVQQLYQQYLLSKEHILHLIAYNTIILRSLIVLNTNKSLKPDQISTLATFIDECDKMFQWISKVTEYEDTIEKKILNATSKDEIDNVLNTVSFKKFDKDYQHITISDKMKYLSQITLIGDANGT